MVLIPIEKEILHQLKTITGRKLVEADLLEWSTDPDRVKENMNPEKKEYYHLPDLGITVAITKENKNGKIIREAESEFK